MEVYYWYKDYGMKVNRNEIRIQLLSLNEASFNFVKMFRFYFGLKIVDKLIDSFFIWDFKHSLKLSINNRYKHIKILHIKLLVNKKSSYIYFGVTAWFWSGPTRTWTWDHLIMSQVL